jgi:predicted secreted protein
MIGSLLRTALICAVIMLLFAVVLKFLGIDVRYKF